MILERWFSILICIFGYFVNITGSYEQDDFRGRLLELPKRFSEISHELWKNGGIPNWIIDIYVPLSIKQDSICKSHSVAYRNGLNNFTLWALEMFDSSSKLPSGLFRAHFKDLGSFDQCLDVDNIAPYTVQHCMLELKGFMKYPKLPVDLDSIETITGGIPVLKPNLALSLCLPASCGRDELIEHYSSVFKRFNLTPALDKYSCSQNENIPYNTLDWVIMFYCSSMISLVILCTLVDVTGKYNFLKGKIRRFIKCFSAKQTIGQILQWKDPRRPLSVLRGLRFLAISWVVLAHNYACVVLTPTLNWIHIYDLLESWSGAFFQNGKCAVDLFLLMSGLLLCYLFMDSMKQGKQFNLPKFYVHRLIRILPTYATVILLAMTIYPRYDSGPLWKTTVERHKDNCMDNWWTNLLFINNYVRTDRQCLPMSWYLSVDMQLHLVSPIILFCLLKWRKFAYIGLPLLILLSVIVSFFVSFFNEIPAGAVIARDLSTFDAYTTEYITTHTRFGSWIIGISLGYILHHIRDRKIVLSKFTVFIGWITSLSLCTSMLFGITYFIRQEKEYNRVESALYTSLQSVLWSLGMSWIIFACETGYAGPIRNFLASKAFQPLGKITFAIYLVHGSFQYVLVAMLKTPSYIEFIPNLVMFAGILLATAVTSFIFCVLVELPFMNLEAVLSGRGSIIDDELEEDKRISKQNSVPNMITKF